MTLTLTPKSRTTASIMRDGVAVGHIGLMAGGTVAFVNLAHTCGLSFVAHTSTLQGALDEAIRELAGMADVTTR